MLVVNLQNTSKFRFQYSSLTNFNTNNFQPNGPCFSVLARTGRLFSGEIFRTLKSYFTYTIYFAT